MNKISKEEIKNLIIERDLTLTDVIDVVIELNSLIGVGLVTLGEDLNDYCRSKINGDLLSE